MPSFAGARELRGLLGLGRNVVQGAGAFLGPQLFMQGRPGTALDKGVQNLPGIIPDPRNDAGRNLGRSLVNELRYMGGQLGRGSLPYLGNEMRYAAGQLSQGTIPYTNASFGGTKPSGGQRNYGPGYKDKELAAGQAAESFRSGAGFPGQQTAADRAYEAEKSRVAQLTAQDPELQRYEDARKIAAAPGATPEQVQSAEAIGMQIWQQKYGNTPMGQPGGAIGVNNPLMQRTFGYQTGSAPDQQMGAPTLGPSPLVPQIDQSLNPASPNYIGGEGAPLMNFADPRFEDMSPEDFQKLLNQVNKK